MAACVRCECSRHAEQAMLLGQLDRFRVEFVFEVADFLDRTNLLAKRFDVGQECGIRGGAHIGAVVGCEGRIGFETAL